MGRICLGSAWRPAAIETGVWMGLVAEGRWQGRRHGPAGWLRRPHEHLGHAFRW